LYFLALDDFFVACQTLLIKLRFGWINVTLYALMMQSAG
jgi:hypothetical protein